MLTMDSSLSRLVLTITEYLHRLSLLGLVYRFMESTANPIGLRGRCSAGPAAFQAPFRS